MTTTEQKGHSALAPQGDRASLVALERRTWIESAHRVVGEVVSVQELDRLGRNLAYLVQRGAEPVGPAGWGLRVLAGDGARSDTTTAVGRLVFGIFAALDRIRTGAHPQTHRGRASRSRGLAAAAVDAYVEAGGLEEPKTALFQTVDPAGRRLTGPGA